MSQGCRTGVGPMRLGNGDHPRTVHFHGHRALEKGHRQDEPMTAFEIQQDPLEPAERTAFDSYPLPDLQERPRLSRQPGLNRRLEGSDFRVVNRHWALTGSDNLNYPRRHQYREPIQRIESTEQVAREQWHFELLDSIGPTASRLVSRQKKFVALAAQQACRDLLIAGPDL